MANQIDATGDAKKSLPEFINADQVAELCGKKTPGFTHMKIRDDRSFPKPLNGRTGAGGPRMLWRRADIVSWLELDKNRKKDLAGRNIGPDRLDNETALKFITGAFDAPHAQTDRQRRIERARRNGVKNTKQIRIQGDWQ